MNTSALECLNGIQEECLIKVMGVGGGGCNALNYMYSKGIENVSFLACNTDAQALSHSEVPAKLQLGPGLGAGGVPDVARQYAEENRERIREALDDGTKMLFITAGMGGGTGTGASAIVAEEAQQMDILTVGIVTIPFVFEGDKKILKAMKGVVELNKHVDALLVINNEKLKQIYPDLNLLNAFSKSDDVVCNAAKAIAEIITVPGHVNTDFSDVRNTLKQGKVAIMNVGQAGGENRITAAINNALYSPLANSNDVHGAKRILLQFYCSSEHAILMQEIDQIHAFIKEVGRDVDVQWGASVDESLGEEVRVTLIATGYEVSQLPIPAELDDNNKQAIEQLMKGYYEPVAQPFVPPVQPVATSTVAFQTAPQEAKQSPAQVTPSSPAAPSAAPSADPLELMFEDQVVRIGDHLNDIVIADEVVAQPATTPSTPTSVRQPAWIRGRR